MGKFADYTLAEAIKVLKVTNKKYFFLSIKVKTKLNGLLMTLDSFKKDSNWMVKSTIRCIILFVLIECIRRIFASGRLLH